MKCEGMKEAVCCCCCARDDGEGWREMMLGLRWKTRDGALLVDVYPPLSQLAGLPFFLSLCLRLTVVPGGFFAGVG